MRDDDVRRYETPAQRAAARGSTRQHRAPLARHTRNELRTSTRAAIDSLHAQWP
jgi:hypothetical protein